MMTLILAAAAIGFAWSLYAQAPAGTPTPAAQPPAMSAGIPYYFLIRMDPVQEETKLSEEQREKVRALLERFEKDSQAEWLGLRELPPDQQQVRAAQLQQSLARRIQRFRTQLEEVLTVEQVGKLQQIGLQMALAPRLGDPRVLQQLGFTREQQQKLDQVRIELDSRMWRLQREMAQKALGLLTPEQYKALQELSIQSAAQTAPGQQTPAQQNPSR